MNLTLKHHALQGTAQAGRTPRANLTCPSPQLPAPALAYSAEGRVENSSR